MAMLHCGQHFLFLTGNRYSPTSARHWAWHGPTAAGGSQSPITLHPITPLPPGPPHTHHCCGAVAVLLPAVLTTSLPSQHCWAMSFAKCVPRQRASRRRQEQAHQCPRTTLRMSWWVSVIPIPHPQIPPRLSCGCAQCPSPHRGDIHQLDTPLLGVLRAGDAECDWRTAVRVEGHQQVGAGGGTKLGVEGSPMPHAFSAGPTARCSSAWRSGLTA